MDDFGTPTTSDRTQADELLARIRAEGYRVAIGDWIAAGWGVFTRAPGLTIGATVLVHVILLVAGCIPFGSVVLAGPLLGGLFALFLKLHRGAEAELNDAFSGFQRFLDLFLVGLLPGLVQLAGMSAAYAYFLGVMASGGQEPNPAVLVPLVLFGVAIAIYVQVAVLFAIPLVIDRGLGAWDALRTSHGIVWRNPLPILLFIAVTWALNVAGYLALCVGALVTLPVYYATLAIAYDDVCCRRYQRPEVPG